MDREEEGRGGEQVQHGEGLLRESLRSINLRRQDKAGPGSSVFVVVRRRSRKARPGAATAARPGAGGGCGEAATGGGAIAAAAAEQGLDAGQPAVGLLRAPRPAVGRRGGPRPRGSHRSRSKSGWVRSSNTRRSATRASAPPRLSSARRLSPRCTRADHLAVDDDLGARSARRAGRPGPRRPGPRRTATMLPVKLKPTPRPRPAGDQEAVRRRPSACLQAAADAAALVHRARWRRRPAAVSATPARPSSSQEPGDLVHGGEAKPVRRVCPNAALRRRARPPPARGPTACPSSRTSRWMVTPASRSAACGREQGVVDADAVVPLPGAGLIVPEGVAAGRAVGLQDRRR